MRSVKSVLKFLTTLFVVALSIFLILIVLGDQSNGFQPLLTPTETPEVGFVLQIPQKALWKNYVTVSAEEAPGTVCTLLYIPPSGDTQEMSSVADENGQCTWRWKVDESQGKGNGRLIITIDGKSETHFFEIRSSF
ncbi:MAG: hypothetical protein WBL25_20895 [Anaerolineales bacterium]